MSETILITGAAGQLGQRIIHHLLETEKVPAANIIAATRDPAKLADLAAKGVITRKADFDNTASLESAFKGVDRLLIISTDALAVPSQRLKQHKAAVDGAVKAGVKHIAYTSMPSPDKSLVTFAPDHLGTENAMKATDIPYTIFRNAWYMDNYLHGMPHNLQSGNWYTSSDGGKVANISREDCAGDRSVPCLRQRRKRDLYADRSRIAERRPDSRRPLRCGWKAVEGRQRHG